MHSVCDACTCTVYMPEQRGPHGHPPKTPLGLDTSRGRWPFAGWCVVEGCWPASLERRTRIQSVIDACACTVCMPEQRGPHGHPPKTSWWVGTGLETPPALGRMVLACNFAAAPGLGTASSGRFMCPVRRPWSVCVPGGVTGDILCVHATGRARQFRLVGSFASRGAVSDLAVTVRVSVRLVLHARPTACFPMMARMLCAMGFRASGGHTTTPRSAGSEFFAVRIRPARPWLHAVRALATHGTTRFHAAGWSVECGQACGSVFPACTGF
jgi:hypothetical protein